MIQQVISKQQFTASVTTELQSLLKSVNEEYRPTVNRLSLAFTEESYKLLNAHTDNDVRRAEANIRHIKASLSHISAQVGLDVTDRLIAITSIALKIAIAAAIAAII